MATLVSAAIHLAGMWILLFEFYSSACMRWLQATVVPAATFSKRESAKVASEEALSLLHARPGCITQTWACVRGPRPTSHSHFPELAERGR